MPFIVILKFISSNSKIGWLIRDRRLMTTHPGRKIFYRLSFYILNHLFQEILTFLVCALHYLNIVVCFCSFFALLYLLQVEVIPRCSILATVGQKMASTPGVSATLFDALAKVFPVYQFLYLNHTKSDLFDILEFLISRIHIICFCLAG